MLCPDEGQGQEGDRPAHWGDRLIALICSLAVHCRRNQSVGGLRAQDPTFDVRGAVGPTAIEGFKAVHALKLISEFNWNLTKWSSVKSLMSWLG